MTDTTPLPCPMDQADAFLVPHSMANTVRYYIQCEHCGLKTATYRTAEGALTAWNTRANADARLVEALRRMTEVAQGYAEYVTSVPSAELERHPYLPGLEDEINAALATLSEAKQ